MSSTDDGPRNAKDILRLLNLPAVHGCYEPLQIIFFGLQHDVGAIKTKAKNKWQKKEKKTPKKCHCPSD